MSEAKKDFRRVILTLGALLALFALVPMLMTTNIPHDMSENLYWGRELQWGYYKHPFLFAWISYGFFRLFGGWPESMYILTQLNMALAFFFIYKIGALFLRDKRRALLAVLLFAATLVPSLGNQKFNANTVLISLLPMAFYFFARFAARPTFANSALVGISFALALMGKYFAAMPLLAICVAYLWRRKNLAVFKTPHPYVALAFFAAVTAPHVAWLFENDFITFTYAFGKARATENAIWGRIKYPLSYLGTQIATMLPAFFLIRRLGGGRGLEWRPRLDVKKYDGFLSGFAFAVPLVIPFVLAILVNMREGTYWAVPLYFLFGVYMLQRNELKLDIKYACRFVLCLNLAIATLGIFAGIFIKRHALERPGKAVVAYFNAREVAAVITDRWRARFGPERPIKYIMADNMTDSLAAYLPDNPRIYTGPAETPAIDRDAMMEYCYVKTSLADKAAGQGNDASEGDRIFYKTSNGHIIGIEFICGKDQPRETTKEIANEQTGN